MNYSKKFRFGFATFVFFLTQAVPRIHPHAPRLSSAFGAQKKNGINLGVHYRDSGVVGVTTNHRPTLPSHKSLMGNRN